MDRRNVDTLVFNTSADIQASTIWLLKAKAVVINASVGNYDLKNPVNAKALADRNSKIQNTSKVQKKFTEWKDAVKITAKESGLYNFDFIGSLAVGDPALYLLNGATIAVMPSIIKKNGTVSANLQDTTITAQKNLTMTTQDSTTSWTDNRAITAVVGAATVQALVANATNEISNGVDISGKGEISGKEIKITAINETSINARNDGHSIGISIANLPCNFTTAKDISRNEIKIDGQYTFNANNATITALNKATVQAEANNNPYFGVITLTYAGTTAEADSQANINDGNGNTFNVNNLNFNAQICDKNTPTAIVTHSATRVLEIVGSDLNSNATAMTQTSANVKIGNENYKETNLTINAQNNASRQLNSKSFMLIGGLQIAGGGAVNSISQGADSANVEAGGGNLSNVAINSTAETYSDNYAHSIAPLTIIEFGNKAQARNYFSGTANAKLKGNWNISGDMSVNVKNEDGFKNSGEQSLNQHEKCYTFQQKR